MSIPKRKVILLRSFAWDTFCPIVFGQRWVEALRWGWAGMLCNWCWSCGEQEGKGLPLNLFLPWSLEERATSFKVTWKREDPAERVAPSTSRDTMGWGPEPDWGAQTAEQRQDCDTKEDDIETGPQRGWEDGRHSSVTGGQRCFERRMGVRVYLGNGWGKLEPVKQGLGLGLSKELISLSVLGRHDWSWVTRVPFLWT